LVLNYIVLQRQKMLLMNKKLKKFHFHPLTKIKYNIEEVCFTNDKNKLIKNKFDKMKSFI